MLDKIISQNLPCGQLIGWRRKSVTCKRRLPLHWVPEAVHGAGAEKEVDAVIVTQWFTQCGDQEVCAEPVSPPEVPGMSWREAGRSVFSESGACSAAVPAALRSLLSLGLACGRKSVQ